MKKYIKYLLPKYQKLILEYKVDFKPRYGHGLKPHDSLYAIIDSNRNNYEEFLKKILSFQEVFLTINDSTNENNDTLPAWNNEYLPGLDIVSLYTMIRLYKPETYIEIGSGNSTKVAAKAIKDGNLSTKIISIDPFPRASIDFLAHEVIRKPLEDLSDLSMFADLKPNDILFIDNSHRCFPNSDVTVTFLDVVPLLQKDVLLHFHDIYLPYDYPQFMCDRFYSEQYLLATMLLSNSKKYEPLLPNFFISEDPFLTKILNDFWENPEMPIVERHGGSFWIRVSD
ncbi:MAG: class I SAM-dependent methyltransferase [Bacteroidales bacterium]|nr:class I SAM-dependent methyltransferase [Bacteroidales bacterium]